MMLGVDRAAAWIAVGMLALSQPACTSLVALDAVDPAAMLAAIEAGDRIRILDSAGATTELEVTSVGVDFIEGLTDYDEPVRMTAADVREIRERRAAPGKTIALGAGVGILLSGLSLAMTGFDWE